MNKVMTLHDAVAKYVENGDTLAIGGFTTNRKPYATVSEILRQGQKDFIVYAGPGGGEVDMLIGEGLSLIHILNALRSSAVRRKRLRRWWITQRRSTANAWCWWDRISHRTKRKL